MLLPWVSIADEPFWFVYVVDIIASVSMLITHSPGRHMMILTDSEASILMDACALLVLGSNSSSEVKLSPGMSTLLCGVFSGLRMESSPTVG